jgi:hypothetical protein
MTALDDFRPGVRPQRKAAKQPWQPPTRPQLGLGRMVCFDPSLSATGVVDLEHTPDRLVVHGAWTLRGEAPSGYTGREREMREGLILRARIVDLLITYDSGVTALTEAPPIGGGRIKAPESAMLGCLAVHVAALDANVPMGPMYYPQRHRALTCGQALIKKEKHHPLLMELAAELAIEGLEKVSNEHRRDALSVGLAFLIERGSR